jgi:hypothetical protein
MKKLLATLFVAALALMGTQAYAQLSANVGYLNSSAKNPYGIKTDQPSNYNGFYAGVTYNIPVIAGLCVAPGVYYSFVGGQATKSASVNLPILGTISQSATKTYTEHALNGAINLNYGFDISRDTRVFLFAGPTFQYGLSSQISVKGEGVINDKNTTDLYENTYNRFNIFLGGGAGFEVANIQVTVGYDYGLLDMSKDTDVKTNRSGLKLGVGFLF